MRVAAVVLLAGVLLPGCVEQGESGPGQTEACMPGTEPANIPGMVEWTPGDARTFRGWRSINGTRFDVDRWESYAALEWTDSPRGRVFAYRDDAYERRWAGSIREAESWSTWSDDCGLIRQEQSLETNDPSILATWRLQTIYEDCVPSPGWAPTRARDLGQSWSLECDEITTGQADGRAIPMVREHWTYLEEVMSRENVTTPAGTFGGFRIEGAMRWANGTATEFTRWESYDSCGGDVRFKGEDHELELTDFGCAATGRPSPRRPNIDNSQCRASTDGTNMCGDPFVWQNERHRA